MRMLISTLFVNRELLDPTKPFFLLMGNGAAQGEGLHDS